MVHFWIRPFIAESAEAAQSLRGIMSWKWLQAAVRYEAEERAGRLMMWIVQAVRRQWSWKV